MANAVPVGRLQSAVQAVPNEDPAAGTVNHPDVGTNAAGEQLGAKPEVAEPVAGKDHPELGTWMPESRAWLKHS